MKNKIRLLTISIMIFMIFLKSISYASFADYDDEMARKDAEEMLIKQEKEEEEAKNKSTNNDLSSLSVKGYTLIPQFSKDIEEYSIEGELHTDSIEIKAKTKDDKATINGTGKIMLENGYNNIRIDVKAECGTVKTYFINVNNRINEEEKNNEISNDQEEIIDTISTINEDTENVQEANKVNETKKIHNTVLIICLIIVVVIIVFIIIKKQQRNCKKSHR